MTAIEVFQKLQRLLSHVPDQNKFAFIQVYLSDLEPDHLRYQVQTYAEFYISGINLKPERNKLVIMIHGIRTQAIWFSLLGEEIEKNDGFKAVECKYGYFDVIRFWFPWWTRKSAIKSVLNNLNSILGSYPNCDCYLIAHSFGTYIATDILKDNPHIKIKKIIFCGAVVSDSFRWDQMVNFPSEIFINECGTKDNWPVIAKSITFGFGATGRFGFNYHSIKNRYHDFNHSDFFNPDFFKAYWIPFITTGEVVSSPWAATRKPDPYWVQVISLFSGFLIITPLVIVGVIFLIIWLRS